MKVCVRVIFGILLLVGFASSHALYAQGILPTPSIASITPGSSEREGVYPGQLVEVTGSGFATRDRQYSNTNHPHEGSVYAIIDGNILGMRTISVSSSKITFVLPVGTPCGPHTMKARNRNTVISGSGNESEKESKFFVACGTGRLNPTPIAPSIDNVQPDTAEPGSLVRITGENFLPTWNYDQLTFLEFRGEKREVEFSSTSEIRFLIPEDTPCSDSPYEIKVVNEVFRVDPNDIGQFFYIAPYLDVESNASTLSVPCAEEPPPPPPNDEEPPPPPVDDNPPPPVNNAGNDLADYDSDGDCMINDGEFFNLIDAWIGEQIENLLFFSGVDAWIGQTPICSAATSSGVYLQMSRSQLLIRSNSGNAIGPIVIYNAAGNMVYRDRGESTLLSWNFMNSNGMGLANGVYLLQVMNTGEIRKVLVLR